MNSIKYPKFISACIHTANPLLISILEDASMGIPCEYIRDINAVTFSDKDGFIHIYNEMNSKRLYELIFSLVDTKKDILLWSELRKKDDKDLFIENYVISKRNEYSLSLNKMKEMYKYITHNLFLKNITSDDILIENNSIVEIIPIKFENGKVIYKNFDKCEEEKADIEENVSKKIDIHHNLDKFIAKYSLT